MRDILEADENLPMYAAYTALRAAGWHLAIVPFYTWERCDDAPRDFALRSERGTDDKKKVIRAALKLADKLRRCSTAPLMCIHASGSRTSATKRQTSSAC